MKKALVILFDKVEELEAIAPIDILRRARIDVTTASIEDSREVVGRSGIGFFADKKFDEIKGELFDAVILPGGPGIHDVAQRPEVGELLLAHDAAGKTVAAICAAPMILDISGVLRGRKCTAHTSVAEDIENCDQSRNVVEDGNVVTSRGAGTATEFALAVLARLADDKAANDIAKAICFVR